MRASTHPSRRLPGRLSGWRRAAAAGATVLALGGLAACGGGSDDSGSDNPFGDSSSSAAGGSDGNGVAAAPGASSADSGSGDHQPGDTLTAQDAAALMKGGMEKITTAHMTMDMDISAGGQSMTMKGEGDMQMSPMSEDITMSMGPAGEIHMIMASGAIYMQAPSLGMGDKWIKIDASQLDSLGMSGAQDMFSNPMGMFDKFSGAIGSAKFVGSESVGGSDADHYTFTIDTSKLTSALGADTGGQLPSTMNEDVWLDDQGRMVQSKVDMGSTGKVTMNLSDFGKSVSIQAPPDSETTSMPTP